MGANIVIVRPIEVFEKIVANTPACQTKAGLAIPSMSEVKGAFNFI